MKTKRIVALLLAFVMAFSVALFTGCSCSGPKDVMGLKVDEGCYVNNEPQIGYSEDIYYRTLANLTKMKDSVQSENISELSCQLLCVLVATQLYMLMDAVNVSNVYYYSNLSNEVNQNGYMDLYQKYLTCMNEFKKRYPVFAESERYKEIFFGEDMTDSEIKELVEEAVTTDKLVDLESEAVDIQTRYNNLTNEQILGSEFDTIYAELVDVNNQIAAEYGYTDYSTYSYEKMYQREFTPADTLSFATSLVDNNFTGSAIAANKKIDTSTAQIENILSQPFLGDNGKAILDGFYKSLGDEIYGIYQYVMQDGYFYIATAPDAYQGAFTNYFVTLDKPFMYFSQSYATVEVFIHEFGHYLRFYMLGGDSSASYELMETNSQAAEWLFMSYLENNYETLNLSQPETVNASRQKYVSSAYDIILSTVVGASEVEVYQNGTKADYSVVTDKWSKYILGETIPELYSGYLTPTEYFRFTTVTSPSYYISYGVSLITSIKIYIESHTSYENAVNTYIELLKTQQSYIDLLVKNGMGSPLDTTTIASVTQYFMYQLD